MHHGVPRLDKSDHSPILSVFKIVYHPGAAAVLLNRTHTYHDLYLAIAAMEKELFDAIDGRLAIADIVENTLPSTNRGAYLNAARNFFEHLWWHDQVVFDTHHNQREQFLEQDYEI
jgi:hypothetical protein